MVAVISPVRAAPAGSVRQLASRQLRCERCRQPSPGPHLDELTDAGDPVLEQVPDAMSYFYASPALGVNFR
jgi:hypothetical protein